MNSDSTLDVVALGPGDFEKDSLANLLSSNTSTDFEATFNASNLDLFEGKLEDA